MRIKKIYKRGTALAASGLAATLALVSNASAAIDWTGITSLDTTDVDTAMGLIIVALVAMWGYRKVIKTMNRS